MYHENLSRIPDIFEKAYSLILTIKKIILLVSSHKEYYSPNSTVLIATGMIVLAIDSLIVFITHTRSADYRPSAMTTA